MQSRMLVVQAIVAGLFLGGPAQAQDTNQLVLKMKDELDGLKAEIEPLKALLQGAVVAFYRSQATGACPRGWKLFEPAGGRVIVGAGTNTNKDMNGNYLTDRPAFKDDPANAIGGEEMHKLVEGEIPNHSHGVYQHAGYNWPDIPNDKKIQPNQGAHGGDTMTYVHGGITSSWGGDIAHNTMPPFVALYYCIKE